MVEKDNITATSLIPLYQFGKYNNPFTMEEYLKHKSLDHTAIFEAYKCGLITVMWNGEDFVFNITEKGKEWKERLEKGE